MKKYSYYKEQRLSYTLRRTNKTPIDNRIYILIYEFQREQLDSTTIQSFIFLLSKVMLSVHPFRKLTVRVLYKRYCFVTLLLFFCCTFLLFVPFASELEENAPDSQVGEYYLNLESGIRLEEMKTNRLQSAVISDVLGNTTLIETQKEKLLVGQMTRAILLFFVILLLILLYAQLFHFLHFRKKHANLRKRIEDECIANKKRQSGLGLGTDRLRVEADTNAKNENQIEKNTVLFDRLNILMEEQKVYVQSSLNRKVLASMLGTNEKYLRETIKDHLNVTVKKYIDQYRLEYAKELLLKIASEQEKYTIESIAVDSGFGARSTFHVLFKKQYGLTPDQFRQKFQENQSITD